jgi:phosphate transport system substrate-binding protein
MSRNYAFAGGGIFIIVLLLGGGAALWWNLHATPARPSILIAGSGAMLQVNQALLKAFSQTHADLDGIVESGGSMPGLIAVKRQAIDIAAMSRDLTVTEDGPLTRSYLIAKSDIVIIVNPDSPLNTLSQQQVRALFSGEITNWKDVDGPDAPVHLVSRKTDSAARQLLEEMVLSGNDISPEAFEVPTPETLTNWVQHDKWAIGYQLLNEKTAGGGVKTLAIDGVIPDHNSIFSGRYPLTQSLYWVLHGESSPMAQQLLAFAQSPSGQSIVTQNHLTAIR